MRALINSKLKITPKTQKKGSNFSLIIWQRQSLKEKTNLQGKWHAMTKKEASFSFF